MTERRRNGRASPRAWPWTVVLMMLALFILQGCGGGSDLPLAGVQGTVTYQGQPLPHGQVVFTPTDGTTGPQAIGQIREDGSFTMETAGEPGVVVGKHQIAVHCREQISEQQKRSMAVPKSLIPKHYSNPETSSLHAEIKPGDNDVPIELQ